MRDQESYERCKEKFINWIKMSEEVLRPVVEKTNEEIFKFFNTFPDINEFKYMIGEITHVIERETFMKAYCDKD